MGQSLETPAEQLASLYYEAVSAYRLTFLRSRAYGAEVGLVELVVEQLPISLASGVSGVCQHEVGRMRRNNGILKPKRVAPVARPPVDRGCVHHAGAHRIHFDIAAAGKQVTIGIDQG